jgi:molybdate transport system substrate-binding protein
MAIPEARAKSRPRPGSVFVSRMSGFLQVILCSTLLLTAHALRAATISLFAAASLSDSLKEIGADYEKQTGDKILFNLGASSTLARQIQEGAPADVFFSADEAKMDALEQRGLVLKETRKRRLSNTLVIVVAADSAIAVQSPQDLAGAAVKRIALADPATVPAGIYAKTCLEKLNLWTAVEPKVVATENVRSALAAVESGNVEAGMVYKTDAGISKKVRIAYEVPVKDAPDIRYPMAVLKDSADPEAAKRFLHYLDSDAAGSVFRKFGFIVLD